MLIISLNLMKIKYCDTETLIHLCICKYSKNVYHALHIVRKKIIPFVINTTITYIIKALLLLNYALTTYKRNV